MQQCIKILLFLILNEPQHVSGDTPPIIRSLKLHKQPLVLHTWKDVGLAAVGRCQIGYATWQRPTTVRPTTFHVCRTRSCLCSFKLLMMGGVSSETCRASFKIKSNKILIKCCILLDFLCKNCTTMHGSTNINFRRTRLNNLGHGTKETVNVSELAVIL